MTRLDMVNKGFFILISRECFDLCEQLGSKNSDIHVLRAFETKRKALNHAKKMGLPIVEE